jgi:hypothetical protein
MSERRPSCGIEHERDAGQQDEFGKPKMAAARKGRPGAYCPPYDRMSDVARAGLAEALRMSLPPLEEIPEGMLELLKRLNGVLTPPQLTTEKRLWCKRVAVGTMITRSPLHRSGRAAFPHPALASGDDAKSP